MSSSLPVSAAAAAASSKLEMLPARLMRFFAQYPPSQYSVTVTGQIMPTTRQRAENGMKPISSTNLPQRSTLSASASPPTSSSPISTLPSTEETTELSSTLVKQPPLPSSSAASASATTPTHPKTPKPTSSKLPPNPFLPYKNPATGRWRGAKIGLRNQADLFKLARLHDVEEMLPASTKSSAYRQQRVLERGLAVRGTGEGQQVKGHKWERNKVGVLERRRLAMEEMPELIRLWQQRGHGRGWKKFPSSKAKSSR